MLVGASLDQFRADGHGGEVVLQVVRQDAEELLLVLGELAEPVAGGFQREVGAHAGGELGGVEGFRDVVHAARLQGADDEGFVGRGGEKDDRDVGPLGIGADALADREPVADGHEHIEEDEVHRALAQLTQGLLPVVGEADVEAEPSQDVADDFEVGPLIVDHQQAQGTSEFTVHGRCGMKRDKSEHRRRAAMLRSGGILHFAKLAATPRPPGICLGASPQYDTGSRGGRGRGIGTGEDGPETFGPVGQKSPRRGGAGFEGGHWTWLDERITSSCRSRPKWFDRRRSRKTCR